jgi:hypothetical protein
MSRQETYIDKENLIPNSQQISNNNVFDVKTGNLASKFLDNYSKSVGSRVYKQPSIDEKMSELLQYIKFNNINLRENPSYNKMVSCYNELVSCLIKEGVILERLMTNFAVFPTGGKKKTQRRKQNKGKKMRKSRRH